MFDFEDWYKKQVEKIFDYMGLDDDPVYTKGFKKFIKFVAFKINPFILSIASFLIFFWILQRIESNYGFERMIMLVCVIVVFTLRGMNNSMKKLTE